MPHDARHERGMALLVVLLALLIVSLVGLTLAQRASTDLQVAGNYRAGNQAFYAADGGAEWGLSQLLEQGRLLGRFPTSAELAGIGVPSLADADFTSFNVQSAGAAAVQPIDSGLYQGLVASTMPFSIAVTAERTLPPLGSGSVEVTTDFDIIPLFQFAVFYENDLELLPGPPMTLNGRVHSNADIYVASGNSLSVDAPVTAAGDIFNRRKDTTGGSGGIVRFRDGGGAYQAMAGLDSSDPTWADEAINRWDGNVRSWVHGVTRLSLTIEDPTQPHTIIEPGRPGDTAGDQAAKIFYEADLRIINGRGYDAAGNPVDLTDPLDGNSALRNTLIWDARENKTMLTTEVDMDALSRTAGYPANGVLYVGGFAPGGGMPAWPGVSPGVGPLEWAGHDEPWSGTGTTEFAVKMTNGAVLPAALTVVSENPAYVHGNYNAVNKKGAAIMADAVTILSNDWGDLNGDGVFDDDLAYSQQPLGSRRAASTTVNAALILGNTNTAGPQYNGGVENLPRFLENWSGRSLAYVGSLISLYTAIYADGDWAYGPPIYNAPNRDWAFDTDFLDPANLPPATPNVYSVRVTGWSRR